MELCQPSAISHGSTGRIWKSSVVSPRYIVVQGFDGLKSKVQTSATAKVWCLQQLHDPQRRWLQPTCQCESLAKSVCYQGDGYAGNALKIPKVSGWFITISLEFLNIWSTFQLPQDLNIESCSFCKVFGVPFRPSYRFHHVSSPYRINVEVWVGIPVWRRPWCGDGKWTDLDSGNGSSCKLVLVARHRALLWGPSKCLHEKLTPDAYLAHLRYMGVMKYDIRWCHPQKCQLYIMTFFRCKILHEYPWS